MGQPYPDRPAMSPPWRVRRPPSAVIPPDDFETQALRKARKRRTFASAMQNDPVSYRSKEHLMETQPDPRRWRILAVLCLSLLVISLDNTILNVALPTLQEDLGASASQLQWIVDSYMLVFAGLLLTAGALG